LKKNIKRVILYAVIAVILIAALYLINNPALITGSSLAQTEYDYSRANNPDYYSMLPPMPSDFKQIQSMWQLGIIRDDPERINESYWKQPEWFPMYNENFLPLLKTVFEEKRMAVWSLGVFDSQIYNRINQDWIRNATEVPKTSGHGELEITNNSVILKHRFWLRASPGAVKIYGVRISVLYPPMAYLKGNQALGIPNETIEQDPNLAMRYIKASTVEKETGSTEFNMGTYWPKLEPNYLREIEVQAEVDKNIPKGTYIVGVNAGAPSTEYQEEQSLKYLLLYTDPNIGMFRGPSEFRLFIEVM